MPVYDGYGERCTHHAALGMGTHVGGPLVDVEVRGIAIGHKAFHDGLEVVAHVGVAVLVDGQRATGMLHKEIEQAAPWKFGQMLHHLTRNEMKATRKGAKREYNLLCHRACRVLIVVLLKALKLFLRVVWQHQIEHHTHQRTQANAADGKAAPREYGPTNAHGEGYGDDDGIACHAHIHLVVYQILYAHTGDGAKEQQHDAAQHGLGNALKQGRQLADDGEHNGRGRRYAYHLRAGNLGDAHGAGHLRVGGDGRATEKTRRQTGQAVAQHGAMKAGIGHKVFLGHGPYDIHVADVLDNRGYGHRNHIEERLPRKLRQMEVYDRGRQGKPRRSLYGRQVDHAHGQCHQIAHDDATYHRYELQQPLTQRQHRNGREKRHGGQRPIGFGHVDRRRGKRQADEDDDRPDDYRREQLVEHLLALPLDEGRHEEIDQCHPDDACQRTRHAPLLAGRNDGGDEGKAAAQEDGYAPLGNKVENEGADTRRHQRRGGVEPHQQGHEHSRAEGDKEELHAQYRLLGWRESLVVHNVLNKVVSAHRTTGPNGVGTARRIGVQR